MVVALATAIGFAVLFWIAISVSLEIIRALRQSHRVASVIIRCERLERRGPSATEWFAAFCQEAWSNYDFKVVRNIVIARDPGIPLKGATRW